MRRCSVCGYKNLDEAASCARCSSKMVTSCPACGQPVPAQSRFCNHCGSRITAKPDLAVVLQPETRVQQVLQAMIPEALADKIRSSASDILGERREVTILFWRIADYAALTQTMGSESLYVLTDKTMRRMADIVYEYEGIIDTHTDDGFMALFGLPVVHENDAERAVRAALDMCEAIEPLRRSCAQQHRCVFRACIGIHTGPVIAGQMMDDVHMAYTVVGDTVSLADRLQRAAQPGTTLVSFETYQCTRPWFTYQMAMVRGRDVTVAPLRAFHPQRVRAHPGRVRGLPGLQVPMIGRQAALANLRGALD